MSEYLWGRQDLAQVLQNFQQSCHLTNPQSIDLWREEKAVGASKHLKALQDPRRGRKLWVRTQATASTYFAIERLMAQPEFMCDDDVERAEFSFFTLGAKDDWNPILVLIGSIFSEMDTDNWFEYGLFFDDLRDAADLPVQEIEFIEQVQWGIIGALATRFIPDFLWSFPARAAPVAHQRRSVVSRENLWRDICDMKKCCIGDPASTLQFISAYSSPLLVMRSQPQSLMRDVVEMASLHTLPTECRHLWQKMNDRITNGRSLALQTLSGKYMCKDMDRNRHDLQSRWERQQKRLNLPSLREQKQGLMAEMKSVGSPNAFALFLQREIWGLKEKGEWSAAFTQVLLTECEVDGERVWKKQRTEEGRAFSSDLSVRWAAIRNTECGEAILSEARANAAQRKRLRTAIAEVTAKIDAGQVDDAVLEQELGLGSVQDIVDNDVFSGFVAAAPKACQQDYLDLHKIIPPMPKTCAFKEPMSCSQVGVCLSDLRASGQYDAVELLAHALRDLFSKKRVFMRRYGDAIVARKMVLVVWITGLTQQFSQAIRVLAGTTSNQLFLRLSSDDGILCAPCQKLRDRVLFGHSACRKEARGAPYLREFLWKRWVYCCGLASGQGEGLQGDGTSIG